MNYLELLKQSAESAGNILCMGLDPVVDALPHPEKDTTHRITDYFAEIFAEMKKRNVRVAAFKPNLGYYAQLDRPMEGKFDGSLALAETIRMIRDLFPGTPIILDSKRGDIATSSLNYAKEAFDVWTADCVTISPYMGTDSVMPFAFENKGAYILNRTSNPGGKDLQNKIEQSGEPFYMTVAKTIAMWHGEHSGMGAVVGATNLKEFEDIATYYASREIPLLIPGVGSQGGTAPEVMELMKKVGYPLQLARINSSSGLTHPWKKGPAPDDYLERVFAGLNKLTKETTI